MAASRRAGRSGRSRLTLVLCIVTSLVALTMNYRGSGLVDGLRGGALDALGPVRGVVERGTSPITDAWHGITGFDDLEAENARLQAELDQLRVQSLEREGADSRYRELLSLLDLDGLSDLELVAARVTAPSAGNFGITVEIDRGSDDGVAKDNPVVAGGGLLVGSVVQVGHSRSVVRLLTDPGYRVGVHLPATGNLGTLHGAGSGEQPTVEHVGSNLAVGVGDVVRTSGGPGSPFPADLVVGRVAAVDRSPGSPDLTVHVEPATDVATIDFIQVVLWTPTS